MCSPRTPDHHRQRGVPILGRTHPASDVVGAAALMDHAAGSDVSTDIAADVPPDAGTPEATGAGCVVEGRHLPARICPTRRGRGSAVMGRRTAVTP